MALDFPDSPAVGDLYGSSGTVWRWDGTMWLSTSGASGARGQVAYAEIVANIGGYTASGADIYGLRATFSAVAGRWYRVTGHVYLYGDVVDAVGNSYIADDAGAQYQSSIVSMPSPGVPFKSHNEYIFKANATGPMTFKMMANLVSGGTAMSVCAATNYPAFILVEDITYEAGSSGTSINPSPWAPVTFLNGWSEADPSLPVRYRKIGDIVYVKGSVKNPASGFNSIFQILDPGFWPPESVQIITTMYATGVWQVAELDVIQDGNVRYHSANPINPEYMPVNFYYSITP